MLQKIKHSIKNKSFIKILKHIDWSLRTRAIFPNDTASDTRSKILFGDTVDPRTAAIARTSQRPNAFQNRRFHTISCLPPPPSDHVSPGAVTAPSSRSCGAVIQHDSAPVHLTDVTDYPRRRKARAEKLFNEPLYGPSGKWGFLV